MQVVALRNEGITAANNSVDFAELFLSLSFFIIVAAILLIVLIYTLHTEKRSKEIAILNSLGFQRRIILKIWLFETLTVIITGSIIGALLGIIYNQGLITGLNTIWNNAIHTNMLNVHIKPTSIAIGAVSSIFIASASVYLVIRKKLKKPIAELVKGNKTAAKSTSQFTSYTVLGASSMLVVISLITSARENAAMYLSAAALFLLGSIMLIFSLMKNTKPTGHPPRLSLFFLALKNLKSNKTRSISVISLLAIGTFTIILTGAYRKTFYGSENLRNSGTGGYLLWAETTSAVPYNLNSPSGKSNLNIQNSNDLDSVTFIQFMSINGDDASCLNLNQAQRPRILAVNASEFDDCKAFSFASLLKSASTEHPWLELDKKNESNVFPAYADQTVIQYGLKKKLGDTLEYTNEKGSTFKLVLTGGLDNSIFQGNILISEKIFREQYPSSGGSKAMLIDAPRHKQKLVSKILEQSLVDYGIEVSPTSQRLATFNSVENTYLSVFMALSGLGLLIGTIGLGIVLLRNIADRKHELSLLIAIGYRRQQIFRLVYIENFILLASGMLIGIIAAIVGILPSLLSPSYSIQVNFLIILIAFVFISGAIWIYLPLKMALKGSLIEGLRKG